MLKPVTEFEDGVGAAKQSNDSYVGFKAADCSRENVTSVYGETFKNV
jgi:hypothetical protein